MAFPCCIRGDELGLLNDYRYQQDETKHHDGRWVHRIPVTEQAIAASQSPGTPQFKIAKGLEHLIKIRQQHKIFGQAETHILETDNQHVFTYARHDEQGNVLLAICNFSENQQSVDGKSTLPHELCPEHRSYFSAELHSRTVSDQPGTLSGYVAVKLVGPSNLLACGLVTL